MNEPENVCLPTGRSKTDKSLSTERAKTDAALTEDRRSSEQDSDESVSKNRDRGDKKRAKARSDADGSNKNTDARLDQERLTADIALKEERTYIDNVMDTERLRNSMSESQIFQNERKATDKDLTSERNHTDVYAKRAAESLSKEKIAHEVTQAALMTRDEILAIVSHDLRNPVGTIATAVTILEDSPYYKNADEESHTLIEVIKRNAREALRLISDLMDIESISRDKFSLQIEKHDVYDIISHSIKSFRPLATLKKITLTENFTSNSAIISCDRERISQVISNLVGNAIKFTAEGGNIIFTIRPQGSDILFSIADTGIGIPEDKQVTVFNRFSQIDNPNRGGLGLGLYISKKIIEAHKGRIWVESNGRQGSNFCFTIPYSLI